MKAIHTYAHVTDNGKKECWAVFKVGRYHIEREFLCYQLPGDVWRMTKNDKEVKLR